MIKIDQALINAFISGSFGLPIAHENDNYVPTAGTAYAEVYLIPNDITPITLSDSNENDGLLRVFLHYKSDELSITAKKKADEIFNYFKIGSVFTYESQKVTIMGLSRGRGVNEKGWYSLPLSIMYRAFLQR